MFYNGVPFINIPAQHKRKTKLNIWIREVIKLIDFDICLKFKNSDVLVFTPLFKKMPCFICISVKKFNLILGI